MRVVLKQGRCKMEINNNNCIQGEYGDDGETGLPGKVGSRGKTGVPGLPGEQGSIGPKVKGKCKVLHVIHVNEAVKSIKTAMTC